MAAVTTMRVLAVVLVTYISLVVGAEKNVTSLGKPISVPASQYWDGKDGPWSTFRIQVGTPPQQLRVLPASDQSTTMVVLPEACAAGASNDTDCPAHRGLTYKRGNSTTWKEYGTYQLNTFLTARVGLDGDGMYGFETMELGWTGDGLPQVSGQLIAGIVTDSFYIGSLALNPRPVNFTDFNNPLPSLMETLRSNTTNVIPSRTWSYTAGSYNLAPKIFGSLVLGGYDSTRLVPNNVIFPFGADISLDFQVAIQSITTNLIDKPLLSTPIVSYINTLVAEIWLPNDTCKLFEDAFGLIWNERTQLYLLNNTLHKSLLDKNPSVTFKLGPQATGPSVTINMPYWNFYLTATSAFIGNQSGLYFPLKRAANDTQYILGRTFLQSAYITADYERNTFNLSQALYPGSAVQQNIVPIFPPSVAKPNSPSAGSTSLSAGAIAGIAVGAIAVLTAVGILIFILYRRREPKPKKVPELADTDVAYTMSHEMDGEGRKYEVGEGLRHEVTGDETHKVELYSDGEHQKPVEADAANMVVYEMPAEDVNFPEMEGEGHWGVKPTGPHAEVDGKGVGNEKAGLGAPDGEIRGK